MTGAQVAVADYTPGLVARGDPAADPPGPSRSHTGISGDPRSRRRRTLRPDQRVLSLPELAEAVYGYSFIVTNLDVSTPAAAARLSTGTGTAPRSRTSATRSWRALRHLPSGYPEINTAWMWGALLAAGIAGWLHQLTATTGPDGHLAGARCPRRQSHDRHPAHRLIHVPARLIRHAGQLTLRPPRGITCSPGSLPDSRHCPARPNHRSRPSPTGTRELGAINPGRLPARTPNRSSRRSFPSPRRSESRIRV